MPKAQLKMWTAAAAVAGFSSLPLTATATDAPPATPRPYPKGITCIWIPTLNAHSYTVIDDRHLVIQGAHRAFYLLTLSRHCTELGTTLQIGLARHDGRLCAPGDSIVSASDRCPIRYIESVASQAEGESIVDARQAAEKARHAPPPSGP